jgi:sigma-E factor negative regulatory protein RseB
VSSDLPAGNSRQVSALHWSPRKLPPGFTLTERRVSESQDGHGGLFEHLVYSDGLAAVSVYVESHAKGKPLDADIQRHGTTHAYSCSNSDVSVTVVGDVPAATVELIGQSVSAATP